MRLWMLAAIVGLGLEAGPVLAQDRPILSDQIRYQGVIPGTPNPPPRARVSSRADRTVVTWPGFQSTGQGTRIFVQTSRAVRVATAAGPSRLVFRLADSVISTRNNRNPLVTSHFNTPVTRAFLRSAGRDVELVIELRAEVQPNVTTRAGEAGFHFVFIDFPGGNFLPEGPPAVPDPRLRRRSLRGSSSSSPEEPGDSPTSDPGMGPTP